MKANTHGANRSSGNTSRSAKRDIEPDAAIAPTPQKPAGRIVGHPSLQNEEPGPDQEPGDVQRSPAARPEPQGGGNGDAVAKMTT